MTSWRDSWRDYGAIGGVTADQAALLEYAVREGSLSLAEATNVLPGVSRRTVQRTLKALVEAGLLHVVGSARSTHYVAPRDRR